MREPQNIEQKDKFATVCWHSVIITDPYQVIAECFAHANISYFRKMIKDVLLNTTQKKIYKKEDPGSILYEFKVLESVIHAAHSINNEKRQSPINVDEAFLLNKSLYCSSQSDLSEWDSFPRSLSLKEYKNPYRAFRNFFKFKKLSEWKEDFQEIITYALGKYDDQVELELLSIYIHLTKLIEAAYLIDLRETTHISGYIKKRTV